jgi:hypothetical protein
MRVWCKGASFAEAVRRSPSRALRGFLLASLLLSLYLPPSVAQAKGPPPSAYTLSLDCPAGTYAYITRISLYNKAGAALLLSFADGTASASTWLECGVQDSLVVTTPAKASSYAWGFWSCRTETVEDGDFGGPLMTLAHGKKATVEPCPVTGAQLITLVIEMN